MPSFRHLLVPVDDTALSAANVHQAVDMAAECGARITFFHAARGTASGLGATGLLSMAGRLMGIESPVATGQAVLAKAMAAAAARGVPGVPSMALSGAPGEAIVAAASAHHCDLIVMASRGEADRGWLRRRRESQTERVLRRAPVPLLVTRVDVARPLGAVDRALGLLQDEHRAIAVVLKSMQAMTSDAATYAPGGLDVDGLERMQAYLADFPACVHHPREERHLHAALRRAGHEADALLMRLEDEHLAERVQVRAVGEMLRETRRRMPGARLRLASAVRDLAELVLRHMALEEEALFPLARQQLAEDDWAEIAGAFARADDPRHGGLPAEEFRRLFVRIASQPAAGDRAAADVSEPLPAALAKTTDSTTTAEPA